MDEMYRSLKLVRLINWIVGYLLLVNCWYLLDLDEDAACRCPNDGSIMKRESLVKADSLISLAILQEPNLFVNSVHTGETIKQFDNTTHRLKGLPIVLS